MEIACYGKRAAEGCGVHPQYCRMHTAARNRTLSAKLSAKPSNATLLACTRCRKRQYSVLADCRKIADNNDNPPHSGLRIRFPGSSSEHRPSSGMSGDMRRTPPYVLYPHPTCAARHSRLLRYRHSILIAARVMASGWFKAMASRPRQVSGSRNMPTCASAVARS